MEKCKMAKATDFESAQVCIKDVLTFLQCWGGCPILNIRNPDPTKLHFVWWSWKVVYAILLSIGFFVCAAVSTYKAVTIGSMMNQMISPLFYFNSFMVTVILIKISKHWMPFMVSLCKTEELINRKYDTINSLRKRVNIITITIFVVAFVEHALATVNFVYSSSCNNNYTGMEYYLRKQFHYIFHYFQYNLISGIVFLVFSWLSAFVWNFGDTIIIVMSIIVSTRFKQMSQSVKKHVDNYEFFEIPAKGKIIKLYSYNSMVLAKSSLQYWKEVREDYNKIDTICKKLDQLFSDLVTLSYSCNLTFILAQLFNSLRQMDTIVERIYFFYSFGFVIVRTISVSIYGAYIYDECKAFIPILNSVPTEYFNQEVHRLALQIHIEPAALSGHNFFKITRGLVLNVAAAIITYELVLIQFNQATLEKYKNQANTTICL